MVRNSMDQYLYWLYSLVGGENGPCKNNAFLIETLMDIDFRWYIPNDENRAEDGKQLRFIFSDESNQPTEMIDKPCSVLEMLIALSKRIETDIMYDNDVDDSTAYWFDRMITNLGIKQFTDDIWDVQIREKVIRKINVFMERTYDFSGKGGIFPLRTPHEDQRNVEIWGQLASFLYENA